MHLFFLSFFGRSVVRSLSTFIMHAKTHTHTHTLTTQMKCECLPQTSREIFYIDPVLQPWPSGENRAHSTRLKARGLTTVSSHSREQLPKNKICIIKKMWKESERHAHTHTHALERTKYLKIIVFGRFKHRGHKRDKNMCVYECNWQLDCLNNMFFTTLL